MTEPSGHALWVNLRDEIGNRMGIGVARVTICKMGNAGYGQETARTADQWPVAALCLLIDCRPIWIGVRARKVSLIEIIWRDGEEVTRVPAENLLGGGNYLIRGKHY